MLGIGLYLFTRQLGHLHKQFTDIYDIVREVNEKEPNKCDFYAQELPTIKEIHKIVEETTQSQFVGDQFERVRKKYNKS